MVEQMAVKRPIADCIGGKVPSHLAAGLNDNGVLARGMITVAGHEFKEMPVDVDRMAHHAVIDQINPDTFPLKERDRLHHVRHLHPVERPHEALHVAGQVQIQASIRRTNIRVPLKRNEVLVNQHPVADVLEALPRLSRTIHRHGGNGLNARPLLDCWRI